MTRPLAVPLVPLVPLDQGMSVREAPRRKSG